MWTCAWSRGRGKSTLLNILGRLDVPTVGRVFYRDRELTRAGESELTRYRRHHVGFVFQFYNLIPSLTARENVALVTDIARRHRGGESRDQNHDRGDPPQRAGRRDRRPGHHR